MECPYCKKELPKGKIPARKANICWYPADKELWFFSDLDDDVVLLAKPDTWEAGMAPAHYCADCRMVFVPVPEREESTMDKLKKKFSDFSEKREAAAEMRQARAEEEKREKERIKRGRKDPWER